MLLRAVQCQGYKGLGRTTNLSLRKVTVLFGKNNSGKTNPSTTPNLTAASFSNNAMYSLVHGDIAFGSSFLDLASMDQPHPTVSYGIEWSKNNRLSISLQNVISHAQEDTVQPLALRWIAMYASISAFVQDFQSQRIDRLLNGFQTTNRYVCRSA